MDDDSFSIYTELREAEMKFKRACEQVVLLNDKLEALQKRFDKARQENHRSFRYNLRLKMATVEGVRNAYYEYACEKAEKIADLRYEVMQLEQDDDAMYASSDDDDHDDDDEDDDENADINNEEDVIEN